jgi:hypothetical protein
VTLYSPVPVCERCLRPLRHPGERPFAVIKHQFGARRFLLRGLAQVRTEWRWPATAFNLTRLISLIRSRAGPTRNPIHPSPMTA